MDAIEYDPTPSGSLTSRFKLHVRDTLFDVLECGVLAAMFIIATAVVIVEEVVSHLLTTD